MTKEKIKNELLLITEKFKKEYSDKFDRSEKSDTLSKNVKLLSEIQDNLVKELDMAKRKYFKENNIVLKSGINKFAKKCHKDFIDFSTTFE